MSESGKGDVKKGKENRERRGREIHLSKVYTGKHTINGMKDLQQLHLTTHISIDMYKSK
jgi:hypothetical protein